MNLLRRLREAGNDYTMAWGSGELYDEAADEIERLTAVLARIRSAIAADRCDGDTEYAAGVNAACQNHLALIDGVIASGVDTSEQPTGQSFKNTDDLFRAMGVEHDDPSKFPSKVDIDRAHGVVPSQGQSKPVAWAQADSLRNAIEAGGGKVTIYTQDLAPSMVPIYTEAKPEQLPPLTETMYWAVRGLEFTVSGEAFTLRDEDVDLIWDAINTALRVQTPAGVAPTDGGQKK